MPRRWPRRVLLGTFVVLALAACGTGESREDPSSKTVETVPGGTNADDAASAIATPRPKRIILISLDTVGSRNVGGYSDAQTPTMEEIAADGVRFEQFYAASTYTLPSHMSMLTGLDPIEHGVVNVPSRLAPEVPTLASQLRAAGYFTKAVAEGGFVAEVYGFDQGFSDFTTLNQPKALVWTSIWGVLDWMRGQKDAPYFLFLHTYIAHTPYDGFNDFRNRHPELDLPDDQEIAALKAKYPSNPDAPNPAPRDIPVELRHMCTFYNMDSATASDFLGCGDHRIKPDFLQSEHFEVYREGLLEAHRASIRRGDHMVGQVRDVLIELGQLEDTLLIVTSDHGEAMFEHSLHGHDYTPYNEVLKVPLFLSYPRRISGGQVVRGLTWHLDLVPTILSLAQVPFDPNLRGRDLTPVMLQQETIPEDRVIHPLLLRPCKRTYLPMQRMTLEGDFKFIPGHRHYGDPKGLLFDLTSSPDEKDNLRESRPELFARLRKLALDYDASLTPGKPIHQETKERISPFPGEVEPLELSSEWQRQLEALGYIFEDDDSDGAE